jgi:hypothetical protein
MNVQVAPVQVTNWRDPQGLNVPYHLAAMMLEHGLDSPVFRHNTLLSYREWEKVDAAIVAAARERMVVVEDLLSAGLTYPLDDALGTQLLVTQKASDMAPAAMDMAADTETQGDRIDFGSDLLPIPLVHTGFWLNIRELRSSRLAGNPLDTSHIALCGTRIMEKIEDNVVNGTSSFAWGGGTIYGFADHPQNNDYDLADAWDESSADPVADVVGMKQMLINDRHAKGPFNVYVCSEWESVLDTDYSTYQKGTVKERIEAIDKVDKCVACDTVADGYVIMVAKQASTVRLVTGFGGAIQTLEWETHGGMRMHYKCFGIIVPQVRADYNDRCGVCLGTAP